MVVGVAVGVLLGVIVGVSVGVAVGVSVGVVVGVSVGVSVGVAVGVGVAGLSTQPCTITSSIARPARLIELSLSRWKRSSVFNPARLSARAVRSPHPALSPMATAGDPMLL